MNEKDSSKLEDIEQSMYDEAMDGDVDAQKAYLELQQEKAISKKIDEMFFPDTTSD